jgi:hypothetical protein
VNWTGSPAGWTKPISMALPKGKAFISNPFRVEGVIERHITKGMREYKVGVKVDYESGEMSTLYEPGKSAMILHDSKQFVKLFTDSLQLLLSFSDSGQKLFLFIVSQLKINDDIVWLNSADVVKACGFTRSTFYMAVGEMLTKKVLARKLGSTLEYWLNPNIVYNGNRVSLSKRIHKPR